MSYIAPIADMRFVMVELAGLGAVGELPGLEDATPDLIEAVLEEAAKFASNVLAPLNRAGDVDGARLVDGQVLTTPGWKEAYQAFVEAGWNGLVFDPEWGGQGLPWLVNAAVQEMWHASNMSFGLCPLLTQGAIEAILFHGSDAQRQLYLPKLVSGEWTGTMCLTEPQAGSDLSAVKTRAVRSGDNYIITGQKIFITYGDHDLTPNIVHLVLARTPDAPAGVKGISLFVVPKFLPDATGAPGIDNDVRCVSLEHKLGIHGMIGALGILALVRSALGRLLVIAGLLVMTTALGYVAISVAEGQTGGNYVFLAIMVGLVVIAVLANVLHPVAWTWDEMRLAVGVPVVAGILAILYGLRRHPPPRSSSARSRRHRSSSGCSGSSPRPGCTRPSCWRDDSDSGRSRPCRSPTTRRRSWIRPPTRRRAGSGSAPASACPRSGSRSACSSSRSASTWPRTSRGRRSRTTSSSRAGRPATPARPCWSSPTRCTATTTT